MKKYYSIVLFALLFLLSSLTVCAKTGDKKVVALGADLTAEQRKTVLDYMGLKEEDLNDCIVISITNDMEHAYLDNYMSSSVIGTKSLSSVLLEPAESGNGVLVTTHNINYCTTGMYRNALLTAGLEDTNVTVVGPTPISGTAALIGAIKGYEEMSGKDIPDSTLDTALDELITMGKIADASGQSDEIEELIAYIKGKLANGELQTEEDIKNAIQDAQERFKVTLTDEEIQRILDVMNKINKLGLDLDSLLEQASDVYDKFGLEILDNPDQAISYIIKKKVADFFTGIRDGMASFFRGLFS